MGSYKYIQKLFKEHDRNLLKNRIIEWRGSESVERVENPLNLFRARSLGYKAKKGYLIVRVRLLRGGRQRPQIKRKKIKSKEENEDSWQVLPMDCRREGKQEI